MGKSKNIWSILACVIIFGFWHFFSLLYGNNKLPSPVSVYKGLIEIAVIGLPPGNILWGHLFASLYRVLVGFFVASAIAIPLGLLMGFIEWVRALLNPIVETLRPIPPLAWVPLAILWMGIGNPSAIFIIGLGTFFPVLLNTISGVENTPETLVETAYTLGAKQSDVVVKVIFPGAFPAIFTGLRIGLDIGWMTLVAAEFTGIRSGYGLGYMIMVARDLQRADQIMAGMVVIGLLGYIFDFTWRQLEKRVLQWR
ncbi:MAG: ABC transporter permease [Bacillota bacterium]